MKVSIKNLGASLAILLFLSVTIFAQTGGTVSGIVSDLQKPATFVKVVLRSLENQIVAVTQTDASGKYIFENVAAGRYIVVAELDAEGGTVAKEIRIKNNQTLTADLTYGIQTPTSNIAFGEVTVIGSGTGQPVDEISKSVSVVRGEEIVNRNEFSVIDALRTVPGLRVQQSGGFGRLASIKIRGLRNQDTAVLIDGQRFRDASAITGDASPFLSDLQVTNISSVEVLRGAGSSLYGTNAIGGVFNIRSNDFSSNFRGNVVAEGGGLGEFRGRTALSGGFNERVFFNLGLAHTNFSKGVDGDDAARNTSGKFGARFQINDTTLITSRFYFADAFVQLNSNPDTIGILPAAGIIAARPLSRTELKRFETGTARGSLNAGNANFIPDANDPDASQASRFYNFNLALDGLINSFGTYRASYQNLTTRRKNINGVGGIGFQPFGGANRSDFDGNIQTFQAKSDLFLRANTLSVGYEFEREKYGNDNFSGGNFNAVRDATDAVQTSNTFFVQDQLEAFSSRLQLSGGFRAQFFNLEKPEFSATSPLANVTLDNPPNAYTFDGSAAYFFRETKTKLRAHIGNGYRVPSLYERFGTFYNTFGTPGFVLLGDFDLKPERSVAFDAGVDQKLANDRVRLSATYFYTRLFNTIGFENVVRIIGTTPRFFGGYKNTKGGIARGGEFSAEFKPFNTTNIFTSYTFTKSLQRVAQVSGSGVLQTLGVPENQFTLVATQKIKRLTLTFDFVATDSYLAPISSNTTFATRIYRFEGSRKGDLTAGYEIPTMNDKLRVRLFGTIDNIFNQDYYENGFRTAHATGRGGLQLSF